MRLFRHLLLLLGLLMASTGAQAQTDLETPLTLEAKTAGTIVVYYPQSGMQYKKNDEAKTAVTCDEGKTFATINVAERDKVQFFGKGTEIKSYYGTQIVGGTADCYIYGNIMSLVDETEFATATKLTGDETFEDLFSPNPHLYNHDTKKLVLPATTLTKQCYRYMFDRTKLTVAPELPATTLADECYYGMFYECTNLTTAPELPATTMAFDCYGEMFYECTNLTTAPELPATTLAEYCYEMMFEGCTGLTTAPELPATTLTKYCYENMFAGCTNLNSVTCLATDISALDATTDWLKNVAATGTFIKAAGASWTTGSSGIPTGWTELDYNIVTPLTLEAFEAGTIVVSDPKSDMQYSLNKGAKTILTEDAGYNSGDKEWTITVESGDKVQFFGNGTSITSYYGTQITGGDADCYIYGNIMSLVDETGFTTATELTGDNTFEGLFSDNDYLYNHDTKKLVLPATTLTDYCYNYMFESCENLTVAPELPATTLAEECYHGMFWECPNLTTAPELLPATTLARECYGEMFYYCSSLTNAPELPATTLAASCYVNMFSGCSSLTTAPELPATTLADDCYDTMFYGCTNLTTAPELPATTLAKYCYFRMFEGCTRLTTAPELPATTLAEYCYDYMFAGCTNLTTAPELPATTLAKGCYNKMFEDCTNLNSVTCLATDISALDATTDWLNNVAATGTFTKAAGASWTTGSSGIPNGWTVNDVQLVTITSAGMATFCFDKALTIPAGVEVWYCRSINEDTGIVFAFPIQSGVIPANTGVFLTGEAGSYLFTVTDATVSAITDNIMVGTTEEITVTPRQVLTLGHDRNGRLGFNYFNGTTIPANKAYIPADRISVSASAISFFPVTPVEDEATGIAKPVEVIKMEDGTIYNLAGQKVKTVTKGIFIKNGKKFIVK